MSRTHRHPYTGSKAISGLCRYKRCSTCATIAKYKRRKRQGENRVRRTMRRWREICAWMDREVE